MFNNNKSFSIVLFLFVILSIVLSLEETKSKHLKLEDNDNDFEIVSPSHKKTSPQNIIQRKQNFIENTEFEDYINSILELQHFTKNKINQKDNENFDKVLEDLNDLKNSNDPELTFDLLKALEIRIVPILNLSKKFEMTDSLEKISAFISEKIKTFQSNFLNDFERVDAITEKSFDLRKKVKKNSKLSPEKNIHQHLSPQKHENVSQKISKEKNETDKKGLTESLKKIHFLQKAIVHAKVSETRKKRFLENLNALERDTIAFHSNKLTSEQKTDLKAALELRLSLLQEMRKLVKDQ